jgi:hypothetical protein
VAVAIRTSLQLLMLSQLLQQASAQLSSGFVEHATKGLQALKGYSCNQTESFSDCT